MEAFWVIPFIIGIVLYFEHAKRVQEKYSKLLLQQVQQEETNFIWVILVIIGIVLYVDHAKKMREKYSKLLLEQVQQGKIEHIIPLKKKGADLEWTDKDGITPLILACMDRRRCDVASVLITLGAKVNAYRRGRRAGTPLHHAADRGLENTVRLLLSHGASALKMNDDHRTPLDIARAKGFSNVVRAIESRICLFSGRLRMFYEPVSPEELAVWVVVLPSAFDNSTKVPKPFKLELAIYSDLKDAQPHMAIAFWKADLKEPKFNQPDPSVKIFHNATETSIIFAPEKKGDKEQLQRFYNACKRYPQATRPAFPHNNSKTPVVQPTAPPDLEDWELEMAIRNSIQSAMAETPTYDARHTKANASSSSVDRSSPPVENLHDRTGERKEDGGSSSSCVICLDAPVEGACVPCGHMAGCMSCLEEIKAKKGDCPLCRAKINQVVKIFAA